MSKKKDKGYNEHLYNTKLVQDAIIKWRGYDERSSLINRDFYEFARFIGHPFDERDLGLWNILNTKNPEVRRLIDLINGPNGHTIIKMLEIKNSQIFGDR